MSIVRGLKDRKLLQWALAYLAGAWFFLEAFGFVVQSFSWPAVLVRISIVLLGVGFLAALVLAWYHGEMGRQRVGGLELLMLAALFVIAGAAVALVRNRTGQGGPVPATSSRASDVSALAEVPSIAVLPFVDMSRAGDQEWFGDGIAEEILDKLSQLENLRVAARTSAFSFGPNADIAMIGRKLSVRTVLEGSVRKEGDQLRITAQLIDAADGFRRWSHTYQQKLSSVFAIQDTISEAIVEALRVELESGDDVRLVKHHTEDSGAHELYLKARYFWNQRTKSSQEKALEYFRRAIERDSAYPLAYVGLADAYTTLESWHYMSRAEAHPKAVAAIRKAVELDPNLAAAQASNAVILQHERDWSAAEETYRRAIQLSPGYAQAHHWYALLLAQLGRTDEAVEEIRRAAELDPLSLIMNTNVGWILYVARDYDGAIEQLKKTLELDSNFAYASALLGAAYAEKGMYAEAVRASRIAAEVDPEDPDWPGYLAIVYAQAGQSERAREILERIDDHLDPTFTAMIHAALGDRDGAFEWLNRAYESGSLFLNEMRVEPRLDPLRGDPRFDEILQAMGLD